MHLFHLNTLAHKIAIRQSSSMHSKYLEHCTEHLSYHLTCTVQLQFKRCCPCCPLHLLCGRHTGQLWGPARHRQAFVNNQQASLLICKSLWRALWRGQKKGRNTAAGEAHPLGSPQLGSARQWRTAAPEQATPPWRLPAAPETPRSPPCRPSTPRPMPAMPRQRRLRPPSAPAAAARCCVAAVRAASACAQGVSQSNLASTA